VGFGELEIKINRKITEKIREIIAWVSDIKNVWNDGRTSC
jgi:hypothetical protein